MSQGILRALVLLVLGAGLAASARAERASAGSDPAAERLARRVLKAMGGRDAWNETRYFAWNFFGRRFHVWDRHAGDLRTDGSDGEQVLMNLVTGQGRVLSGGKELAGDELAERLELARRHWINDSYWLAMPFKLLDEGVRLRGPRPIRQPDGEEVLALRLTFQGVGVTPWNAYDVHVDPATHVVRGWSFYRSAGDSEPLFQLPWILERRGGLLLPVSHGRDAEWSVEVFDEVPRSLFSEFGPPLDMPALLEMATPIAPREPRF